MYISLDREALYGSASRVVPVVRRRLSLDVGFSLFLEDVMIYCGVWGCGCGGIGDSALLPLALTVSFNASAPGKPTLATQ